MLVFIAVSTEEAIRSWGLLLDLTCLQSILETLSALVASSHPHLVHMERGLVIAVLVPEQPIIHTWKTMVQNYAKYEQEYVDLS